MTFLKPSLYCLLFLSVARFSTAEEPTPVINEIPALELIPAPDAPPESISNHSFFSQRAAAVSQFEIDTSDRETVRLFYNSVYFASEGFEMSWTGDYLNSNAGDVSADYREATRLRINFYRAMAGIPSWISFDPIYSGKNQKAALIMSGEGALSHTPPVTWNYYSADGAEGAANSNIALGSAGADSITGYMRDHGAGNERAGHRKWFLHPPHQTFGSGSVPGDSNLFLASENFPNGQTPREANAVWVFDGNTFNDYPTSRDGFIAWPPKGYVPYTIAFARWSFAVENGDLSQATITLKEGETNIPVTIDYQPSGDTREHLVWVPQGKDTFTTSNVYEKPDKDTTYTVNIQNVWINGSPQSFSYDVTLFDPDVPTPGASETLVSGIDHLKTGQPADYLLRGDKEIDGLQWRKVKVATFNTLFDAEGGLGELTSNTGPYEPYSTTLAASGSRSYRLGVLNNAANGPQSLTINDTLIPSANTTLNFKSRVGLITDTQTADVEISTDGGNQWESIWQKSISTSGQLENSYHNESVDLSAYAGASINIRFILYTQNSYYPLDLNDPNFIFGWAFDDISISNTEKFNGITESPVIDGRSFEVMSNSDESFFLQVRPRVFDEFFLGWGELIPVQVSAQGGNENGFATLPDLDGWQETVYGWISTKKWPWVYHFEHGWGFAKGNANGLFFFDRGLNAWTYSDATYYPWIYHYGLQVWIRHQPGSISPDRWFWASPGSISGQLSSGWIQEKDF